MKLRYYCYFGRVTGYGRAAHDYLLALHRHTDLDIEIVPIEMGYNPADTLEPRYRELLRLLRPLDGVADVEIWHEKPSLITTTTPANVTRVAMTTWETQLYPDEGAMRFVDGVIVPSEFCRSAFLGGLVFEHAHADVYVVPHTFDPEFWEPSAPREDALSDDHPLRFYTIGAWNARKNPIAILKAYLHAFSRDDLVDLLFVSHNLDTTEVNSTIARSLIPAEDLPSFQFLEGVDETGLYDLHEGGDVFVSATRGEGWGLGLFEAAVMGKTIVAPRHGGQADFLRKARDTGIVRSVAFSASPCFGAERRGSIVEVAPGAFAQQATLDVPRGLNAKSLWYEPDIWSLANLMRNEYHGALARRGVMSAQRRHDVAQYRRELERSYSYETVGPMLAGALAQIHELRTERT